MKRERMDDTHRPPWFAGVHNWRRFHQRAETEPVKIKGDPDRYLNAHARRRKKEAA